MAGNIANTAVSDYVTWAWEAQSVWSQAADKLKRSLLRARNISLALTIAAAVLTALAAQAGKYWGMNSSEPATAFSVIAAVSMGLVTLLQMATRRGRVESWTRSRSVSEALKADIYVCLAGVDPYRGRDADSQFRTNVERILADADDISDVTVGLAAHHRELPAVNSVDSYVEHRVQDQIDAFYRPKSELMKRRAGQYRFVEIALAVVAVGLSAGAAGGLPQLAVWTSVLTTIVAATTAHAAVQRYDALALEYTRTYKQLERLLRDRDGDSGQVSHRNADADDKFVAAAEGILSAQNQAWMARNVAALSSGKS